MGHPTWPLFDLEVRTPRLTLRYIDDELAVRLIDLARRGIHDPAWMPFTIPWTDAPSPRFEWQCMQFYWQSRAEVSAQRWRLPLAVLVGDEVVGASDIVTRDFPVLAQFETGSWLGRQFQGHGLGKELRLATLTLGFDGFGAEYATTSAYDDNGPSLGVTRSLGYQAEGRTRERRRNEAADQIRFRMPREHFETIRRADIALVGVEAALPVLGVSEGG